MRGSVSFFLGLGLLATSGSWAAGPVGFEGLVREREAAEAAGPTLREVFESFPAPCESSACLGEAGLHMVTDNVEAWAARWAMIDGARESIDLTYYIIADDVFGMSLLGHLYKKARDGVKVRLLVDAAGSPKFKLAGEGGKDILQELANAGAEVKLYVPMWKGVGRAVRDRDVLKAIASNHDKILLVDGQWAMTGGRNISADYYTSFRDHPTGFRDTDVLLAGEGPYQGLRKAFLAEFEVEKNEVVVADRGGNMADRSQRLLAYYQAMDSWLRAAPLAEAEAATLRDPGKTGEVARESRGDQLGNEVWSAVPRPGGSKAYATRMVAKRKARKHLRELAGYPDSRGSLPYDLHESLDSTGEVRILDRVSRMNPRSADSIGPGLMAVLGAAREEAWIANPYVVLLQNALKAFIEAGRNGVHTTILTNSPVSTDSLVTQAYFLQQWPQMVAQVENLEIHVMNGEQKLHAKVAVFDGVLSLVGTYNMDLISGRINSEVLAAIWSQDFAARKKAAIVADLESPANDTQEYTIARDASGAPLYDGCVPRVAFGPEQHIDPGELSRIKQGTLDYLEGMARRRQDLKALGDLMPVHPEFEDCD